MAIATPVVAAVMVGANNLTWIGPALTSLLISSGQGDGFDLVSCYVDNGSKDGSAEFVRSTFPTVQMIENGANLGFAAANNQAAQLALDDGVDYLFLVNPDTWTPPDLLLRMTRFMQRWPSYGIIGPLQWAYNHPGDTDGQPSPNAWTIEALRAGERHVLHLSAPQLPPPPDPGTPRAPHTVEHAYVQGAALFARADMLRRIDIFDETYHTFYEETDLCRRARIAGWRVALLTDLGIYHKGAGGGASAYRRLQMMRNKYYFLLTDIDLPVSDMIKIAAGWLRRDLAGDGVGGPSSRPRAWLELARSTCWLASQLLAVSAQRRRQRGLRRSATRLRPPR